MSECQFTRSQRIVVPAEMAGADGVQGIVVAVTTFVGREPEYGVQWLVADTVGELGGLVSRREPLAESVLLVAQPPKMIPADDVAQIVATARQAAVDVVRCEYANDVKRLQGQIAKLERRRKRSSRAR